MTHASDTPEERFAEYGRLFEHALLGRERTADAVELTFAAKAGVAEWVADLARREAACCPFFSHRVTFENGQVSWRLSSDAGPEARAILDELYALAEKRAADVRGLLERLALGMRLERATAEP